MQSEAEEPLPHQRSLACVTEKADWPAGKGQQQVPVTRVCLGVQPLSGLCEVEGEKAHDTCHF